MLVAVSTLKSVTHSLKLTHLRIRATLKLSSISKCSQLKDLQLPTGVPSSLCFLSDLPHLESLQICVTDETCREIARWAPRLQRLCIYVDKGCSDKGFESLIQNLAQLEIFQCIFSPYIYSAPDNQFLESLDLSPFDYLRTDPCSISLYLKPLIYSTSFPKLKRLTVSLAKDWERCKKWLETFHQIKNSRKSLTFSCDYCEGSLHFFDLFWQSVTVCLFAVVVIYQFVCVMSLDLGSCKVKLNGPEATRVGVLKRSGLKVSWKRI
jgi:hypothetical protein